MNNTILNKQIFDNAEWSSKSTNIIINKVKSFLSKNDYCRIAIPGGRCATKIFNELSKFKYDDFFNKIKFYILDERNVSLHSEYSNYNLINNSLFFNKLSNKNLFYFDTSLISNEIIIENYIRDLPKKMDITILSLGDDGHIASIFPNDKNTIDSKNDVIFIKKYSNFDRFTLTPKYISNSQEIILLAYEISKRNIYQKILIDSKNNDYYEIPARLFINGTWLVNKDLE